MFVHRFLILLTRTDLVLCEYDTHMLMLLQFAHTDAGQLGPTLTSHCSLQLILRTTYQASLKGK